MSYLNSSTTGARVAYAKKCILSDMGRSFYGFSRAFDDCFENGDGDKVFALLFDEAENNLVLRDACVKIWKDFYARALDNKYCGLTRKEIYAA